MALQPCPECGHQVSHRATNCPDCGAPIGTSSPVPTRASIEEWAVSQLKAGAPRRPIVEGIVRQGRMPRSDADALVKRLESALVPGRHAYLVKVTSGVGIAAVILVLVLLVGRLLVA